MEYVLAYIKQMLENPPDTMDDTDLLAIINQLTEEIQNRTFFHHDSGMVFPLSEYGMRDDGDVTKTLCLLRELILLKIGHTVEYEDGSITRKS